MKNKLIKIYLPILILSIISIISIYLSKNSISNYEYYILHQTLYIFIGNIIFFFIIKINIKNIDKYYYLIYIFLNIILIYLLLFGRVINGSKSWIKIFGFSIQPSEFMKIILILLLNDTINRKHGILKSIILVLIPSILTFLEPDTGTVLFYLIILLGILLNKIKNKKTIIYLILLFLILVGIFFYLYYIKIDLFIKILGTDFFYRIDRIIHFFNSDSMQLNNALIGIGNTSLIGSFSKYVIYIPESITDFMFANTVIEYGLIGTILILLIYLFIEINLIKNINNTKNYKYYLIGLTYLFIYQTTQHILMNIGLLPITGITLPFISFGGSSIISYYILFAIYYNVLQNKYNV